MCTFVVNQWSDRSAQSGRALSARHVDGSLWLQTGSGLFLLPVWAPGLPVWAPSRLRVLQLDTRNHGRGTRCAWMKQQLVLSQLVWMTRAENGGLCAVFFFFFLPNVQEVFVHSGEERVNVYWESTQRQRVWVFINSSVQERTVLHSLFPTSGNP